MSVPVLGVDGWMPSVLSAYRDGIPLFEPGATMTTHTALTAGVTLGLLAAPLPVDAQLATKGARVGILSPGLDPGPSAR